MSYIFIWPIDRTLLGVTTPCESGSGSNGHEGVLQIPQSFRTGASPSDSFVSYPGHSFGWELGSYSFAEVQSVNSIVPTDWPGERKTKEWREKNNFLRLRKSMKRKRKIRIKKWEKMKKKRQKKTRKKKKKEREIKERKKERKKEREIKERKKGK